MRKIIFYCDKCGKQMDSDFEVVNIIDTYDLCSSCAAELSGITQRWISGQDLVPKPKKKPRQNKADIDMPKVHALQNAGWSLDKVGDEFGVSGQTIANHLKAEKEAGNGED